MAYQPTHVANVFLELAKQDGRSVSNLKLQKLLYFFHVWHLVLRGSPGLDGRFSAWKFGPVMEPLYHEFKRFQAGPINAYATEYDLDSGEIKAFIVSRDDQDFWSFARGVWQKYGHLSALQLSDMTHTEGSPWHNAIQANKPYIDNEEIRTYFSQFVQTSQAAAV